ncbi:MAG TPA: methyl-accepting chemotaxis protein [Anaeromyxobacteraceae bacterium]|nr:methyl-accepting chemotaxis protein [Anaeromyxobacteraceae bacterium]
MRLRGLKYRHKLLAPAAVVLVAAALATVATLYLSRRADVVFAHVQRDDLPVLNLSHDLETLLFRLHRTFQDAAGAQDTGRIEEADAIRDAILARLELAAREGVPVDHVERHRAEIDGYFLLARSAATHLARGGSAQAIAATLTDMSTRYRDLQAGLAKDLAAAKEAMDGGIDEARALHRTSVLAGAILFLAGALASAAVAAWLASEISEPLEALQRAAAGVAEGDLTQPLDFHSEDEVGALADAFRGMVERLRGMLSALRATSSELTGAADTLTLLTQAQTELLETQAWNVARTTTTTRDLERSAALASSRTDSVLAVARRAGHVGETGQTSATRSLEGIGQIRDSVRSIISRSTQLRDQTRQVGEVVESVMDLATRSHVLSLNASIEAQRAGESGKGFAVVAAEMRALADQSGRAAAHIGKTVEDILAAIEATLRVTDASNRGMEGSMAQIRASGESLREIGAIAQETSEAALQIAAAVTEQGRGIGQIAVAMRELNTGMEATVNRIQEVEEAAAALKKTADRIGEIAHGFRV